MSVQSNFYAAQAESCARAARESNLPMQREKYERAGAAWLTLANRENEIAAARDRRLAEAAIKAELPAT
ncbi:hypothetical protein ACFOD9_02460 [Novosphingobium bradum]|uniref:Uncharacterized protein n=1 Tax=Novosphingobium bradum TaxID=1737444 RepID=A0ABV7IM85_9SPHN